MRVGGGAAAQPKPGAAWISRSPAVTLCNAMRVCRRPRDLFTACWLPRPRNTPVLYVTGPSLSGSLGTRCALQTGSMRTEGGGGASQGIAITHSSDILPHWNAAGRRQCSKGGRLRRDMNDGWRRRLEVRRWTFDEEGRLAMPGLPFTSACRLSTRPPSWRQPCRKRWAGQPPHGGGSAVAVLRVSRSSERIQFSRAMRWCSLRLARASVWAKMWLECCED